MKCAEKGCHKNAVKHRTICYMHKCRRYAAKHPMRAAFLNLRGNAKRRGKVFDLTFDQFKSFAIEVDLLHKRGRTSKSYTVDRIDNEKGYTVGNLQMLTYGENSRKGMRKIAYDYETKFGYIVEITSPEIGGGAS